MSQMDLARTQNVWNTVFVLIFLLLPRQFHIFYMPTNCDQNLRLLTANNVRKCPEKSIGLSFCMGSILTSASGSNVYDWWFMLKTRSMNNFIPRMINSVYNIVDLALVGFKQMQIILLNTDFFWYKTNYLLHFSALVKAIRNWFLKSYT